MLLRGVISVCDKRAVVLLKLSIIFNLPKHAAAVLSIPRQMLEYDSCELLRIENISRFIVLAVLAVDNMDNLEFNLPFSLK